MKLFKISQTANDGWYTYDSAIVSAETSKEAKRIIPSPFYIYDGGFYYVYKMQEMSKEKTCPSWTSPANVTAVEVGETDLPAGEVVCASFRAGFDESRYWDIRKLKEALKRRDLSKSAKKKAQESLEKIYLELQDPQLAELRYHFVEANRNRDLQKIQDYEIKLRDYTGEIYEDWS